MQTGTAARTDPANMDDVLAALEAADHERASELARAALESGVPHPLFLNLRAWWHERNGRPAAALSDLQHAHTLAPEDVPVLNALGLSLERLGRARDAFDAFDNAATLAPGFAPAQMNRGRVLETLGDFDAARASYERALQLGHNAHGSLAALAARRADWPNARLHAQQALSINAGDLAAEQVLASAEIAAGDHAAAKGRLSRLLESNALAPADRATTLSLLGDALDAQGAFESAFASYAAGNAARLESVPPQTRAFAVENMRAYLDRLSNHFSALPREASAAAEPIAPGNEEAPRHHVLVIGFARSGTTLVEEILARHPDVESTQEKDALSDAVANLFMNQPSFDRLMALKGGGLARYRRGYWRALAECGIKEKSVCVVDKQPYNTIRLPLLAKLFPGAKILFCLRDPRDVVLSCFRRRFLINDSNLQLLTLEGAARFYDSVMQLGELYREKLSLDLLEVRHEEIVADFDAQTHRICAFIGIPWVSGMRNLAENAARRSVVTPSAAQLAKGLNAGGIGHWRNYRAQLEPVLPILAPWVERFGYAAN